MKQLKFSSLTGILAWTGETQLRYVDNDNNLPYARKGDLFYYFTSDGQAYTLQMTSSFNIMEAK